MGLSGKAIPLAGRICAVVDVFDALTSNRSYRDALAHPSVYQMMQAEEGRHFDPRVLAVFFERKEAIEAIQRDHRARHAEPAEGVSLAGAA